MIEQGIVMLINTDPSVIGIIGNTGVGGFFATLPKDQIRPSWTYKVISCTDLSGTVEQNRQVVQERWQLDFFGDTAAEAILLAQAVDNLLNRFSGALPDPDATLVQAIFRVDLSDDFDSVARSYRRMIDYQLTFTR